MANEGDILKSVSGNFSPEVTDFERGQRIDDGQDVRRSTISITPLGFETLRRPIFASSRQAQRAPGFIGRLDEALEFFEPLVEPDPAAPDPLQTTTDGGDAGTGTGDGGGLSLDPQATETSFFGEGNIGQAGGGSLVGGGGDSGSGGGGSASGPDPGESDPQGAAGGGAGSSADSPGNTGDKIICTELYRQGLLSVQDRMWSFRGTMTLCSAIAVRGYHWWAIPVVRALRRGKWKRLWTFVVRHRAHELAYQLGLRPRPDPIGKLMRLWVEPISFVIGHGLELLDRVPDPGALYDDQYPRI